MRSTVDEADSGKPAAGEAQTAEERADDNLQLLESFSFPRFGESPGPTPRSTPAGTPEVISDAGESETEASKAGVRNNIILGGGGGGGEVCLG